MISKSIRNHLKTDVAECLKNMGSSHTKIMGLLENVMGSQNMQAVINNKLADRLNTLRDHLKTLKGHLIK